MAKKSAQKIIEEQMPDLQIVESTTSAEDSAIAAAIPSPTIDQLKAKFLSMGSPDSSTSASTQRSRADELRMKFLGSGAKRSSTPRSAADAPKRAPAKANTAAGAGPAEGTDTTSPPASDVKVVQVRPKKTPADPVDDPGPRTMIISESEGIVGMQG